jgi:diguanylate cyclase (GGDEF)-like protein
MVKMSFKRRVLILAVALVMAMQVVALFPVLSIIRRDADERARDAVGIGGAVFREFMENRAEQLRTTVSVLVSDFGFKQAAATGDAETIRSALINHSARVGADMALLLDLDGNVLASSTEEANLVGSSAFKELVAAAVERNATHTVTYFGGIPYQTVTVLLRAPAPIAWVVMGFQIDQALAERIEALTGLEVSVVRWSDGRPNVLASTLPAKSYAEAIAPLELRELQHHQLVTPTTPHGYLTLLQPFLTGSEGSEDLYVALQSSLDEVTASYRNVRNLLLLIMSVSLLLAVVGSVWLASTVTRPVSNLVAAVKRLRKGVYTEPIEVASADEFGDLAGAFNAMQEAIAERADRIRFQADHDSLSQLPNRHLLLEQLQAAVGRVSSLTVLSVSIDRFDSIAASLGHRAGDQVIKLVAQLMCNSLGKGELLAHLGGNQFIVVVPEVDADRTTQWVERLTQILHAGVRLDEANISLRATVGIARFPEHSRAPAELLHRASIANSTAQAGREPFAVYQPGQEEHHFQQIKIIGDFPRAIRDDELRVYVQPKVDCATERVCGAEALIRWQHPELGLLMPAAFVDAIEQAGSIRHLTRWVLREAIGHCAEWHQSGFFGFSMSVNLSVDDLLDQNLPYYLLQVVGEHGVAASCITLEVTESAIMTHVAEATATLQCIRELGFRIAIDDFGTGHSSLAQLKRLPLDELKIDKAFAMSTSSKDAAIVRTIIELSRLLDLKVVAEGVEDAATLHGLAALGCELAQGYYFSRPIGAERFIDWVREWQNRESARVVSLRRDAPIGSTSV